MLLVSIVVEAVLRVYTVTHTTGDNGRRSCVTTLYKLLMLLVIMVAEAVLRVYISCSCFW